MTEGFEVLVHEVMAAITTDPYDRPVAELELVAVERGFDARSERVARRLRR
jgi:hypothetical protein